MVVGIAEMLLWLLCLTVKRGYGIYNAFDQLICWLGIVYNVCISQIVRWCLVLGPFGSICKIYRFVSRLVYV